MKKRLVLPLCLALALGASLIGARAAPPGEADAPALAFDENGYFTVMVLADAQDTGVPVPYLRSGVEAALEREPPDLVILLGDQLEGGSPLMRIGNREKHVSTAIDKLLAPIAARGIPFAVVFGNHDSESGVGNALQMDLYRRYPGCVSVDVHESGAYRLPVAGKDGSAALELYLFDSGTYTLDGGYACVSREQVDWYIAESSALRQANAGQTVPAVAFQHIIVGEIYDALTEVPPDAPGALQGVGNGADRFFSPASPSILAGEMREAPCPSAENNGQFDAFLAQGDVFALFCGHDHVNDFIVSHRGIDLVACPGATYTSYNARAARGVRMLRFSEDNVRDYETMLIPFAAHEQVTIFGMLPYYLLVTTRIPNLVKVPAAALLIAAAICLAVRCAKRARRPKPDPAAVPDPPPEFDE